MKDREAFNEIVVMPTDGSAEPGDLVSGNDFYAFPRLSPDESKLCVDWSGRTPTCRGTELSSMRVI